MPVRGRLNDVRSLRAPILSAKKARLCTLIMRRPGFSKSVSVKSLIEICRHAGNGETQAPA